MFMNTRVIKVPVGFSGLSEQLMLGILWRKVEEIRRPFQYSWDVRDDYTATFDSTHLPTLKRTIQKIL